MFFFKDWAFIALEQNTLCRAFEIVELGEMGFR